MKVGAHDRLQKKKNIQGASCTTSKFVAPVKYLFMLLDTISPLSHSQMPPSYASGVHYKI